ncbi:alpha/beta hydrolase-fold protein [Hoylesella nanceiensis]|uniref:carboxylesterase family protein n=1 Tax=Hoylesella nanceiensis TaxID=425941 RepID=UPI0027BAA505|nr:alpha/beta hydrolase-fold protein [Hoylesella nanceiensis]
MSTLKHSFLIAICLLFVIGTPSFAQRTKYGEFSIHKELNTVGYNFWLYTPNDYEPNGHPLPLVIFLHGASLCGNNIQKVRRYGVLDAIDKGKIIPTLVVAPQNPGGAWNAHKLNDLLEWMKKNYKVDDTRVYVLGMSLGGYGTMDFVGAYPEKIAAAMALCGGCSLRDVSPLGKVPLWIMHGTADRAVSVKQSQIVVEKLQEGGNDKLLRYDWLQGGSHGILARLFYLQKTYDWLFSHSLQDNPRTIDKHFDITPEDIHQTYQELRQLPQYYEED